MKTFENFNATNKIVQVYKTRKDELIDKTLEIMPQAFSGDIANVTFYFEVDAKTNELSVDYLYYQGHINLNDRCFYTIFNHEYPTPEDYGYESIGDMDFAACGFTEQIENSIEKTIMGIENH